MPHDSFQLIALLFLRRVICLELAHAEMVKSGLLQLCVFATETNLKACLKAPALALGQKKIPKHEFSAFCFSCLRMG